MADNKDKKVLNVPPLRFPEFSEEWEKHTLSEYLEFKNGLNPDAKRIGSGLPFISVMDILSEGVINYDNIRGKVNATEKEIECFGVKDGDLLFQRSSETLEDVGRANVYMDNRTAIYGGFVIRGRKIGNYNPLFFKYLLATSLARKRTCRMGAGAQHFNIGQEGLSKISLYFPSIEEQRKIARFLSLIDERIATQNKIIEDLKKLKSAIVDNLMTPQKEWESTKIVNVLSIGSGRDYKHLRDGNIPVYGTGGYMLSVDSYLYDGESVCIGRKGTINKPIFLKGKFWTVDTLFYTHTFRSITPRFCYYLFTTIDWLKYNEASGVPSLSKVTIENISISIPDLVTQKQICAVLDSMTDKLDIEQKLLDAYHAQKQYLLQQIFI